MPQDLAMALHRLVPVPQYFGSLSAGTREAYDSIVWNDNRSKPSYDDLLKVDLSKLPRQELKALAAKRRYWRSVEGFSWNGHLFRSDERSQAAMAVAAIGAMSASEWTGKFKWKTMSGEFVELNAAGVIELTTACADFTHRLFAAEAAACIAIDAGIITTDRQVERAIDIACGNEMKEKLNGFRIQIDRDPAAASGNFPD